MSSFSLPFPCGCVVQRGVQDERETRDVLVCVDHYQDPAIQAALAAVAAAVQQAQERTMQAEELEGEK